MILKYSEATGEYYCVCSFDERWPAKNAGLVWYPERIYEGSRRWWTSDPVVASKLSQYADHEAMEALKSLEAKVEASRATDADIDVPCPQGLSFYPFQKAGVAYIVDRRGKVLLADEMGLGKTCQAIGYINMSSFIRKILCIVPASLKINWQREFEKFSTRNFRTWIASGSNGWPEDTELLIINYDILERNKEALLKARWDIVVIDECHMIKNPKAKRTRAVMDISDQIKCKILLTGTPIMNRPVELFPLLKILDHSLSGNWRRYVQQYCDGRQEEIRVRGGGKKKVWNVTGASNLDELQRSLRSTIMIRRLKQDVLTELPPKVRQVIELPQNGMVRQVAREQKTVEKIMDELQDLAACRDLAVAAGNEEGYGNAVAALREAKKMAFTQMAGARHDTAVAKLPAAIEYIKEMMESTEKCVVFCHHHDCVDGLLEGLEEFNPVSLTGRDSQEKRQDAVDRFQADQNVRVFIGSTLAAGVGLTLTAASTVIFCELDWVPANISQAEDRLHRIGQEDSVLVQHLVVDGTMDARMAKMLVEKQDVIDRALDKGAELAQPLPLLLDLPDQGESKDEEIKFSEEETAGIRAALQLVAGMCDGAVEEDGAGFNKYDTRIGKDLAGKAKLSPKQLLLARKILQKYKRQIPEGIYETIYGKEKP